MNDRVFIFISSILLICAPLRAEVLINEFLYDPPGADAGSEWVELYNTGSSTVSLEGWTLQTDDNTFPGISRVTLCGAIAPQSFYLIRESSQTLSTAPVNVIAATLSMGNATSKADGIQLLDKAGNLRDRVVYGGPDSDQLCAGHCSTAPRVSSGFSVARSSPGSIQFMAVVPSSATPMAGSGSPCVYSPCPSGSGFVRGMLSEVAPSIPNDDFVELYLEGSSNLCGVKLYENGTLIKTFPSVTPKVGPFGTYLVLHAGQRGQDETDEVGDANGNGVADLYSDENSPGLTGSVGGNLLLRNSDGTVADFISWSVGTDTSYDSVRQIQYDAAVSSGAWHPPARYGDARTYLNGSAPWANRSSESLSRRLAVDGTPLNSHPSHAGDWQTGSLSMGRGYGLTAPPPGELLEVHQSPFSPFGDGRYSEAILICAAPDGSVVSLTLYDAQGLKVVVLLDQVQISGGIPAVAAWRGQDNAKRTVSSGLYIAHAECRLPNGSVQRRNRTVIVGRPL